MIIRKKIEILLGRFEKNFATHNRIEVSKSALLYNLDLFASLGGKQVIPVLKGNAYGHGIEPVAKALGGRRLPYIAVDGYFEALRVREVSKQPVLIMGMILPTNFARLKYDNFAFVVQDKTSIRALGKTGKRIAIHVECNTGMNRYGVRLAEIEGLTKLVLSYKNLTLEGVMSHLADSDGEDHSSVEAAVKQFDLCVEEVRAAGGNPSIIHVAQSAGSLRAQSKYANSIRVGIGLYGINPFQKNHPAHQRLDGLRPALKLISTITKIIELQKGDQVSYNYTFTAPNKMKIGVLPLGYYEGVSRELSNSGEVKIGKQFAPIVGRVCMNHTMIGLDNITANMGDEAIVYNNEPFDKNAIGNAAAEHGLFNYSLLTGLNADIRRVLVA